MLMALRTQNPVLLILNILIMLTFVLLISMTARLCEVLEFYRKCERHNKLNTYRVAKEPEPFFDPDEVIYTTEDYMNSIFEEYAKHYEDTKEYTETKEQQKQNEDILRSRVETFPACYKTLGFKEKPKSEEEIKKKYRDLAKKLHPDSGGSEDFFIQLNDVYKEALEVWKKENS